MLEHARTDLFHWLADSYLIVDSHNGHQRGIGPHGGIQILHEENNAWTRARLATDDSGLVD